MARTLLLADNNIAIQRIVALTFATEDVTVISVGDGEQAIARIAAEPPDIVLADTALPGRNGYEVSAFIKGRPELAHIPALLLAGALERVDVARAAEARCDGVIVKPFEPQQVITRVRELLAGAAGGPERTVAGVPRPIDRLIEPRAGTPPVHAAAPAIVAAPAAPERHDESPLRIVKQPTAAPPPAAPAAPIDEPDPSWSEPEGWPEPLDPPSQVVRTSPPTPMVVPPSDFGDDPLGDYFDKLDEAFDSIDGGWDSAGGARSRQGSRGDDDERRDLPTLSSVLGDIAPNVQKSPSPLNLKEEILFGAAPVEPPPIRSVHPPSERRMPPSAQRGVPPTAQRDTPIFRAPEPRPEPPVQARATAPPAAPPAVAPPALPVAESPATPEPPRTEPHRSAVADAFEALMAVDEADRQARLHAPVPAPSASSGEVNDAFVDAVAARVVERLVPGGVDALISRVVTDVAERLVREEIARIRGRQ
jgi:CheY-like chemotaxis protein